MDHTTHSLFVVALCSSALGWKHSHVRNRLKEKHTHTSHVFMNECCLRSCSFSLSTAVSTGCSVWDPELFLSSQGLMSGVKSFVGVKCTLLPSPTPKSWLCSERMSAYLTKWQKHAAGFFARFPGMLHHCWDCSS